MFTKKEAFYVHCTAPPDLANEPVGRLMLRLSIPTITAQLVNMLYNLVDRIYISYIPDVGTLALTGLGVCLPIILLVSAFAALCASSGAPLASIAMGQRNNEKAEGILGSCTALLLCVSAVLTVVLSCFYTPILLAFGATEDALPYAQRYIALQPRHGVRAAVSRLEPVHHRAGLLQGGDADGADWRGAEHAA